MNLRMRSRGLSSPQRRWPISVPVRSNLKLAEPVLLELASPAAQGRASAMTYQVNSTEGTVLASTAGPN
jgi:hypothetical protein